MDGWMWIMLTLFASIPVSCGLKYHFLHGPGAVLRYVQAFVVFCGLDGANFAFLELSCGSMDRLVQ